MSITISLKWENVSPDSPEGKAIYSIEPGATWFELRLPSIKRACEVQEMAQFLLDEGQRIGRNKALQQMQGGLGADPSRRRLGLREQRRPQCRCLSGKTRTHPDR